MTAKDEPRVATAADYGLALGAHVGAIKRGRDDAEWSRTLVAGMMDAPIASLGDLLALVTWAGVMADATVAALPEDPKPFGGPRAMAGHAAALLTRARQSLEAETGIAPEVFIGSPDHTN